MKRERDLFPCFFGSDPQPFAVEIEVLPFDVCDVLEPKSGEIAEQNQPLPDIICRVQERLNLLSGECLPPFLFGIFEDRHSLAGVVWHQPFPLSRFEGRRETLYEVVDARRRPAKGFAMVSECGAIGGADGVQRQRSPLPEVNDEFPDRLLVLEDCGRRLGSLSSSDPRMEEFGSGLELQWFTCCSLGNLRNNFPSLSGDQPPTLACSCEFLPFDRNFQRQLLVVRLRGLEAPFSVGPGEGGVPILRSPVWVDARHLS